MYVVAGMVVAYGLAVVLSHAIFFFTPDPRGLQPGSTTSPTTLRVMTYNVYYEKVSDETANVIRDSGADIVSLQESNQAWEDKIRATAGERFPSIEFRHETYAGGSGVLSRYPLQTLFYEQAPASWFNAWGFVVDSPAGKIKCLNLHLRPVTGGGGGPWKYLNYFRLGSIHAREVEYLYQKLESFDPENKLPTLILGDFNEADDGNAIQFLKDRGLLNAVEPFDAKSYTWHSRIYGIAMWARPDHVLHSSHFRNVDAGILKEGESDHRAVMAMLSSSEAANIPAASSR
jgi:endonuclease/exonuclease/phosphatase family metal-dependent hydrolase